MLQFSQELGYIRRTMMEAAIACTGSSWLSTTPAKEQVAISISIEEHVFFGSWLLNVFIGVAVFKAVKSMRQRTIH